LIVNHALDATFELSAQWYHVATLALRDEGLLQEPPTLGGLDDPVESVYESLMRDLQLTADAGQLRASRIQYVTPLTDTPANLLDKA
jgi:hypothetical protein